MLNVISQVVAGSVVALSGIAAGKKVAERTQRDFHEGVDYAQCGKSFTIRKNKSESSLMRMVARLNHSVNSDQDAFGSFIHQATITTDATVTWTRAIGRGRVDEYTMDFSGKLPELTVKAAGKNRETVTFDLRKSADIMDICASITEEATPYLRVVEQFHQLGKEFQTDLMEQQNIAREREMKLELEVEKLKAKIGEAGDLELSDFGIEDDFDKQFDLRCKELGIKS